MRASMLLSTVCILVGVSCGQRESRQDTSTNTSKVPDRALGPVKTSKTSAYFEETPVQKVTRPKLGRLASDEEGAVITTEQTLHLKPKYYSGAMPLKYVSLKKSMRPGEYYTVCNKFEGWRNEYMYSDEGHRFAGLADGVRAIDDEGHIIAEAQLSKIIPGQAIEVEEFHYTDRGVRFYCKSRFPLVPGHKESESEIKGSKAQDYFFLWPTMGF